MDKPIPPRHRAYPLRPPAPKPAPEPRVHGATVTAEPRNGNWTRAVPDGRRFPRG
jgi:hypothetical protein